MSKRKRAPKPTSDETTDDASAKEDMVHVTPDLLAGSPDIFADKKPEDAEPESSETPEPPAEPIVEETTAEAAPPESDVPQTSEASGLSPEPPVAPPAPYVNAVPYPARPPRGGSSAALGIVLVVVGLFALL